MSVEYQNGWYMALEWTIAGPGHGPTTNRSDAMALSEIIDLLLGHDHNLSGLKWA